jgi:hydrogenase maturation factor
LTAFPAPETVCGSTHCITCGDDGEPMEIVSVDADRGLAVCRDEHGAESMVETALVEPIEAGERVLVHAGTAIAVVGRP